MTEWKIRIFMCQFLDVLFNVSDFNSFLFFTVLINDYGDEGLSNNSGYSNVANHDSEYWS